MNRTFFSFIRYRLQIILFYAAAAGLYLAIQYLGGFPLETAVYAILLAGVILFLGLLPDAISFFRKHRDLKQVTETLSLFEPEFPDPSNLLERDYTEIAESLYRSFHEAKEEIILSHTQNLDYYTLWVHQIKTPIAGMQLVLQDMPDSPEKETLMQELFGIERYTELALQYARLGSIASDLVITPCALEPIVRECVKKYALLFIYKKLTVDIGELPQTVLSDAKWLRFIIEQILSNALKYTRTGGVRVFEQDGDLVIQDTGCGIRPEDLPRIFEKGYTGFQGRTDARASGIGLYMCKKAADSLSISIKAQSTLGKGTRFTLVFPNADGFIFQ